MGSDQPNMTYHEIVVYPNGLRTEKVAKVYESHQHVDILPNGSTTLDQLQRLRALLAEAEKALTNTLSLAENVDIDRGHSGPCGPDMGCDGQCMAAHYAGQILDEARAFLAKLRK